MSARPAIYRVGSAHEGRRVLQALSERFPARRQEGEARIVTFFDTFDWRLYRQGCSLLAASNSGSTILRWTSPDGTLRQRLARASVPPFARDLPAGPLRHGLEPIVEMRRLLPQVKIEEEREELRLLDEEGKTVARVVLERGAAFPGPAARRARSMPVLLHAVPVKGYEEAWAELTRVLDEELAMAPSEEDVLTMALAAVGREPADYSSKLRLELDPLQRADEAAKKIQLTLLETILANEEGVLRDLDSEFLHDFRVAVRRTRSALSQIKGVFPEHKVRRFQNGFKWLGSITGPTRDLDVYLLQMDGYRSQLPVEERPHLDPLEEFLARHREAEHRRLARKLETKRYRQFLDAWRRFLESPCPPSPELANATRPIRDVARERIEKVHRRVLRSGQRIGDQSPAEELHRLRIRCKKLRYLLEFFRSLFEHQEMGATIRSLKRLQDNLGDFNDLQVQQASIKRFADQMLNEGIATSSALLAMGRLLEHLEREQKQTRLEFAELFREFSDPRRTKRLRRLLAA